jgi:hypothetical protein
MKTLGKTLLIFLPLLIIILPYSCEDRYTETYTTNVPVYMSYEDMRTSVELNSQRELSNPGKLYFYNNLLFIVEDKEGVHIINNEDVSNPTNIGFINIPGNVDIAVKNNMLYADSYIDLVVIDISNLSNPQEVGRVEDVFPYVLPQYDTEYRVEQIDEEKGVVIDWEVKKITKDVENYNHNYPIYPWYRWGAVEFDYMALSSSFMGGKSMNSNSFGVGGSMARFTIKENSLYTLGNNQLGIFDISDSDSPSENGQVSFGETAETLFPYNDYLFLGTQTGMIVYDISSPENPTRMSTFNHIQSCDPVVVEGNYAYVTLRDGNNCGRTVNELDVVDISNIYNPVLTKSYPMKNPHGLGIDNGTLFICDGDDGLKVYNASNPLSITSNKLAEFPDINTYDVIPYNDVLMMIGKDGFYQYDYSNLSNITLLSTIQVAVE